MFLFEVVQNGFIGGLLLSILGTVATLGWLTFCVISCLRECPFGSGFFSKVKEFFKGILIGIVVFGEIGIALTACVITLTVQDKIKYDEFYKNEYHEIMYSEIYSINRDNEVSGRFCLGCGTINSETYYYFYTKTGNDRYILTKLKFTNNVYIVETNNNSWCVTKNKNADSTYIYYEIIVPKGTLIQSFNG